MNRSLIMFVFLVGALASGCANRGTAYVRSTETWRRNSASLATIGNERMVTAAAALPTVGEPTQAQLALCWRTAKSQTSDEALRRASDQLWSSFTQVASPPPEFADVHSEMKEFTDLVAAMVSLQLCYEGNPADVWGPSQRMQARAKQLLAHIQRRLGSVASGVQCAVASPLSPRI